MDALQRGGRKILDLVNCFSMFLKHIFFMFCGYFGHFYFFGQRGTRGGAKIFGRVAKGGGQKILDLVIFFSKFLKHSFFIFMGILGTFNFLVKGGAKNFTRHLGKVCTLARKYETLE